MGGSHEVDGHGLGINPDDIDRYACLLISWVIYWALFGASTHHLSS